MDIWVYLGVIDFVLICVVVFGEEVMECSRGQWAFVPVGIFWKVRVKRFAVTAYVRCSHSSSPWWGGSLDKKSIGDYSAHVFCTFVEGGRHYRTLDLCFRLFCLALCILLERKLADELHLTRRG